MYSKVDDFLVLHFSGTQIIWDTTKACDLLKKSKKNCIPLCMKMLLFLDEFHVYIFSGRQMNRDVMEEFDFLISL